MSKSQKANTFTDARALRSVFRNCSHSVRSIYHRELKVALKLCSFLQKGSKIISTHIDSWQLKISYLGEKSYLGAQNLYFNSQSLSAYFKGVMQNSTVIFPGWFLLTCPAKPVPNWELLDRAILNTNDLCHEDVTLPLIYTLHNVNTFLQKCIYKSLKNSSVTLLFDTN